MSTITLRDYQEVMAEDLRASYKAGRSSPLLVAPTGSGKTVLFSYIADRAGAKGNKVLILVHRRELLFQTSETLSSFGVPHGMIAPGISPSLDGVQVASVQTVIRRLDKMKGWDPSLIVVDEAHHATSASAWGRVLNHWPSAKVLGVTATPERLDGRGLGVEAEGFFDTMVEGPTTLDLCNQGHLSRPVVFAPSTPDLKGVHTRGGDFATDELEKLVNTSAITGDAAKHYKKYCDGKPAIAFCVTVKHAEQVAKDFWGAGLRATNLDGSMSHGERKEKIRALGAGELHVLTSCMVVSEGTDIPIVAAAILLRPTQSLALYLQQCGRALRPYPGKERSVILDHAGNALRHGLPEQPRVWSLDAKQRRKRAKGDDALAIRQCPKCFAVHEPAPVCPNCGHEYVTERKLEHREGELQRLTLDEEAVAKANAKRRRRYEEVKAETYEELLELGRQRGYKNPHGWAHFKLQYRREKQRKKS